MASYSVFGYIKTPDGRLVPNARVYPYFKKVSAVAPASKWADSPYTVDNKSYFGFDLGDSKLIGTESTIVKTQDKIYIVVVWNENTVVDQDRNSLTFTHCAFVEHVTKNEDFVEINITIEPKRLPILDSFTFSSPNLLTRTNYTMSETSHADYTWKNLAPYSVTPISQKLIFDLVPIFDGHQMIQTIYDWGETIINRNNSSNSTYQYDIAGVYNTCITVREKWNTEVKTCQQVTVKYNKPVPNFNWTPILTNNWEGSKIKGTELITFNNSSSDIDNRVKDISKWGNETYYYEWTISDKNLDNSDNTKVYSNVDWNYKPNHRFQSPGTKNIMLKVFWNDGFNDYIETITKQIIIEPFNIVPNFLWNKIPNNRNDLVTFTSTTTGDTDKIVSYKWVIEDNYPASSGNLYTFKTTDTSLFNEGSPDNTIRVDNLYDITTTENNTSVKFHSTEEKNINLTITYFNGWENVTKSIDKDITPIKYNVIPNFSISNINPRGRYEIVRFNNTTNYNQDGFILAYTVDWNISDFYSEYNLDNTNKGIVTDNTKIYLNELYNKEQIHYYQNNETNNVVLTIRYDDGWQMQTKELLRTVTPIVFDGIIQNFTFNIPRNRLDEVQIENTTTDSNNRFRKLEFIINDKYNKFNPDNPNYGISITNNSAYIDSTNRYEIHSHYFQDSSDEIIELIYYYDDGFEEQYVEKQKIITKIINYIDPDFEPNITPVNGGFLGKNEIIFKNITQNNPNIIKFEDERWIFNDRDFLTNDDVITERKEQQVYSNQAFTFTTPSRMPFSSKEFKLLNEPTVINKNKNVLMELRIDNGWRNDTELGNYLDPNNFETGGEVYFTIDKDYEATPNELSGNIRVLTNILNYNHN